ncbi:MAG: hypothetical protein WEC81_00090 [Patescibacteria group bacterium]
MRKLKVIILAAWAALTIFAVSCNAEEVGYSGSNDQGLQADQYQQTATTEDLQVGMLAEQEPVKPIWITENRILVDMFELVGKDAQRLGTVLGEPGGKTGPFTHEGVTFIEYDWYFPKKDGKQEILSDWNLNCMASVDTGTGIILAVAVNSRTLREPLPTINELLAYFDIDEEDARFSSSLWDSKVDRVRLHAKGTVGNNLLTVSAYYDGKTIEKITDTDFSTGEHSAIIRLCDDFSMEKSSTYHIYLGTGKFSTFNGRLYAFKKPDIPGTPLPKPGEEIPVDY